MTIITRSTWRQTGWISEAYVQDRGPGAGGPAYPWTLQGQSKDGLRGLSNVAVMSG